MTISLAVNRFAPELEQEYIAQRLQNAEPMLRFVYLVAGLLPFVFYVSKLFVGENQLPQFSAIELIYYLFWISVIGLSFSSRIPAAMPWSIITFVFITTLFFSISELVAAKSILATSMPVSLFLLFGIVICQLGFRLTVVVGITAITIPLLVSISTNQDLHHLFANGLMMLVWLVLSLFASMILDRNNRRLFEYEKQLMQARDLTEDLLDQSFKANEAKSRFLANMSHEIRTPLTSIMGYADAAIDNPTQENLNETLNIIKRNSKHLLSIINDILDLSKIEAEQLRLESIPYPLFELTTGVTNMMSHVAAEKGLMFDVSYQFPLPEFIYCDPTRIKQILLNLTNNAIKFTDSGGVTVRIGATDNQRYLQVEVTDTGIGMSEEESRRVFDAFTQADTSTSRKYGGTGLGLHLTKQLVHAMGGQLNLNSEKNKGSTFSISIPLKTPKSIAWLNKVPEVFYTKQENRQRPEINKLFGHVLLAEDNVDNQNLIKSMLQKLGLYVDAANNGEQAVELALANDYDLILMDIQMPVMDGMRATQMLRKAGDETPIIALTANVMQHEIKQYQQNGFDNWLAKPISKQAFVNTIQKYVRKEARGIDLIDQESAEFKAMTRSFVENLKNDYQKLTQLMATENWQETGKVCHAIKGTAGNFGYSKLSAAAGKVEQAVKSDNVDTIYAAWVKLCAEIEKVI